MAVVDCFGKQTPKGPNYHVTDKFSYPKGPEWKIGTNPRNTLDTKAIYEHYFRKDIDVAQYLYSLTSTRLTRPNVSTMAIPALAEIREYLPFYPVPSPWEKV